MCVGCSLSDWGFSLFCSQGGFLIRGIQASGFLCSFYPLYGANDVGQGQRVLTLRDLGWTVVEGFCLHTKRGVPLYLTTRPLAISTKQQ